jgi:hypothetical protein
MTVNTGEPVRSESSVVMLYIDHVSTQRPAEPISSTYLIGIPGALDIWVELQNELGQALGPGPPKAALVEEKVDTQVGLADFGLVVDGEAADAWSGVLAPSSCQVKRLSPYLATRGSSTSLHRRSPRPSSLGGCSPTRGQPGRWPPTGAAAGHICVPFLRAREGSEGSGS